jgi:succinate dehydrogenase flavin-adding protein (antitoxin of CptAB toxin-antitoxin module)
MNVQITVKSMDTDTRRGLHESDAAITFTYEKRGSWYTEETERQVVDALTNKDAPIHMWYYDRGRTETVTETQKTVTYRRVYGYDSGD